MHIFEAIWLCNALVPLEAPKIEIAKIAELLGWLTDWGQQPKYCPGLA